MSVNAASSVSNVAANLQQLNENRQQQMELDIQIGEASRRARQQTVDQSFQDMDQQAKRITEIKQATLQARSGGIDVWA